MNSNSYLYLVSYRICKTNSIDLTVINLASVVETHNSAKQNKGQPRINGHFINNQIVENTTIMVKFRLQGFLKLFLPENMAINY